MLEAFLFGLAIAIAIGPIALIILNTSIRHGVASGIACGAGAASADFTFALIAFTAGSGLLALLDAWRATLALAGAMLLCVFGLWLVSSAWRNRNQAIDATKDALGFRATYFLTLANPLTILFFAAWLGGRRGEIGLIDALFLALAVFVGSLAVQSALALGGGALRPFLAKPKVLLSANLVSGLGIFGFGVAQLLRG